MIIESDILLSKFNTFKTGGCAKYFVRVKNIEDLKKAVSFAKRKKLPFFVLGGGSNILVSDNGFYGLVIKVEIKGIEFKKLNNREVEVWACSGENWDSLVKKIVDKNLYGMENLSLIPGTVGASVVQNIGAYGSEIKDIVSYVEIFDTAKNKIFILNNKECLFGYRESIFKKNKKFIVVRVAYVLTRDSKLKIEHKDIKEYFINNFENISLKDMREAIINIRKNKMPDLRKVGTAGSFFKNPIIKRDQLENLIIKYPQLPYRIVANNKAQIFLAWVLDNICGLKGKSVGNIGVSDKQPLILINYKSGTTDEIKKLAKSIARDVYKKTGIKIFQEVVFLK